MNIKKQLIVLGSLLVSMLGFCQTVSSVSELESALNSATAGTTITIVNGTYTDADLEIEATGTAANPIIIQAETPGGVIFEDNCRIKMGGAYITLTGVMFTGRYSLSDEGLDSYVINFSNGSNCDNCTVTQVQIDDYNQSDDDFDFRWIHLTGQDNVISYNTFIRKNNIGSMLYNNRREKLEDRTKIHHNYFAYRNQVGEADSANDIDVMRIGDSSGSLTNSSTEVYNNYFYETKGGEPEVISNKSSNNKYYNNTFENYLGSLSLRHGNDCEVYNNFFLNPGQNESYFNGGIRIEGERHQVFNNYIQGTNGQKQNSSSDDKAGSLGGINVSAGQSESNFELSGYGQVIDAIIVNNTFVDCDQALRIGADSGGRNQNVAPDRITVANNLFVNCGEYLEEERPATNSIFEGNMFEGNGSEISGFSSETGLLSTTVNADGYYSITKDSPAVDASVGDYLVFFMIDVFNGTRAEIFDVGSQEYGTTIERGPYTQADVGLNVGFGASSGPVLNTSPSSLSFSGAASDLTFDVITENETSWTITENVSWITVSSTNGVGGATITVSATSNEGGDVRSGIITIKGDNGESSTINILQTGEDFTASVITVVGSTATGTETGKDNVDANFAWDGSVSNEEYWSGDAALGEVSITFDLECNHELTEIGIHLLKADERTVNFDVSIAKDGSDDFTTILNAQDSSISSGGVNAEQLFDLVGNTARYVKFTGNSNSDDGSSEFISVAEISLYGNSECSSTLNIDTFDALSNKGVVLFPVPVTNGALTISSSNYSVGAIYIYDMMGQQVIIENAKDQKSMDIDTSSLTSGIYFIVLEDIGVSKFIVK